MEHRISKRVRIGLCALGRGMWKRQHEQTSGNDDAAGIHAGGIHTGRIHAGRHHR